MCYKFVIGECHGSYNFDTFLYELTMIEQPFINSKVSNHERVNMVIANFKGFALAW